MKNPTLRKNTARLGQKIQSYDKINRHNFEKIQHYDKINGHNFNKFNAMRKSRTEL